MGPSPLDKPATFVLSTPTSDDKKIFRETEVLGNLLQIHYSTGNLTLPNLESNTGCSGGKLTTNCHELWHGLSLSLNKCHCLKTCGN
jgi:hypothetical protein